MLRIQNHKIQWWVNFHLHCASYNIHTDVWTSCAAEVLYNIEHHKGPLRFQLIFFYPPL